MQYPGSGIGSTRWSGILGTASLKHISDRCLVSSRRNEVRSAEGRQEIVERHFVGEVGHRKPEYHLVALGVEQIVGSERNVKQIPGLHAVRVMVVVFRSSLGQSEQCRSNRTGACPERTLQRGGRTIASQADVYLLRRCEFHGRCRVGNAGYHQSAVVTPYESPPNPILPALIAKVGSLLERLIVIDAEHTWHRGSTLEDQATVLRRKITSSRVPECRVGLEAVDVHRAQAPGYTVEL